MQMTPGEADRVANELCEVMQRRGSCAAGRLSRSIAFAPMALRKRGIGVKSGRAQFAVGSGQRTKLKGSKVKRKVNKNRANESIWDIDQAAGAQEGLLNPVAVEILCRGIKGIEPLIPPWAEGVEMPISDIALAFERYFNLWDEAAIE